MRKIFLVFLLGLFSFSINAQSVKLELEYSNAVSYKGGVLLNGYKRVGPNSFVFVIEFYDNSLKKIKSFEKKIPGEMSRVWAYCTAHYDCIDVYFNSNPTSYFLKLTNDLEEISFVPIEDKIKNEELQQIKSLSAVHQYIYANKSFNYARIYEKTIKEKAINSVDEYGYNFKEKMFIRYKPVSGLKYDAQVSPVWKTSIADFEFKKINLTGIIYYDDIDVVACFNGGGTYNLKDDFIIRFNAKTGEIKSKIITRYTAGQESFFMTNSFYDSTTGNTLVSGQLYILKRGNIDVVASAFLIYNNKGELITQKKIDYPEPPSDIKFPNKVIFKDKWSSAVNIGKANNGKYFVINVYECKYISHFDKNQGAVTKYNPYAFSYFELDVDLNIENNKMVFVNNFDAVVKNEPPVFDEKFLFYSYVYKNAWKVELIDFFAEDPQCRLVGEYEEKDYPETNSSILILDESHAVIYYKSPNLNNCELTSITIKN